jgi:hypothetical protein
MTEEELLRHQEMLFAGSKARYEAAAAEQWIEWKGIEMRVYGRMIYKSAVVVYELG